MDWGLAESVQDTLEAGQRALRSLPSTLSAYKLSQPSPVDHIEPDPVAKMKCTGQQMSVPRSKFLAPPPKPACLEKAVERKNLEKSQQLRAADIPPKVALDKSDDVEETKRFTLEDLLTPDYDGYHA